MFQSITQYTKLRTQSYSVLNSKLQFSRKWILKFEVLILSYISIEQFEND